MRMGRRWWSENLVLSTVDSLPICSNLKELQYEKELQTANRGAFIPWVAPADLGTLLVRKGEGLILGHISVPFITQTARAGARITGFFDP